MVKCVQLVGRLRDRATALFGGKVRIRIVVATISEFLEGTNTVFHPFYMHINKYMFGNMSGMSAMGFTYIFRQMGSFLMVHGFGNVSAASLVLGECGLQRKSHRKSGLQVRQVSQRKMCQ